MKKQLIAVGTGVATASAVFAMAATLGGITTEDIGADTTVVAACDNDGITLDFNVDYDAGTGDYTVGDPGTPASQTDNAGMVFEVISVDVSGIDDACVGQTIDMSLSNQSGKEIETTQATITQSGTVGQDANTITLTVDGDGDTSATNLLDGINATEVDHAGIVIQG